MKLFTNISKFIGPYFVVFASAASIISLILVFISNTTAVIVALTSFIIFLFALSFKLLSLINSYLEQIYPVGYHSNFAFIKYTTIDGKHIVYESYKALQCKMPIMLEYNHGFKWSGNKPPVIKSSLQTLGTIIPATNNTDYDRIPFCFTNPLLYNQSAVLHINMELDDSDGKSSPYLESRVASPVEVICYRVELFHKDKKYKSDAKIYKRLINAVITPKDELITSVPFNQLTKSFEYFLLKPQMGYYYRMEWEK